MTEAVECFPSAVRRDGLGSRKSGILRAATASFGERGVKGSSLRDIAADAGVSLTLLDHHFGSKAMLLAAVVEAHHVACRPGLAGLRSLVGASPASLRLDSLVRAWIAYEFDLYDTTATVSYLRLLVRLHEDPDVDNQTRSQLHCAQPLVLQGLRILRPGLDAPRLDAAWLLASAPVYAAILNARNLAEDAGDPLGSDVSRITHCFVFAGLEAYLDFSDES